MSDPWSQPWNAFSPQPTAPPPAPRAAPRAAPSGVPAAAPVLGRGERAAVLASLASQRSALVRVCDGLTPAQLATRAVPPSDLSLLGIVRHLTAIEYHWFRRVLGERLDLPHLWADDPTGGFRDVLPSAEAVQLVWQAWAAEVEHAQRLTDGLPEDVFGVEVPRDGGGQLSVRDLLVHMVEEYARHLGHADLLRERLDGRTTSR